MCELPECFVKVTRRARKEHRCCECRGAIKPGELYHYASGIWLGKPDQFKTCAECQAMRDEVMADATYPEEGPAFGELVVYISEVGNPALLSAWNTNVKKRGGRPILEDEPE